MLSANKASSALGGGDAAASKPTGDKPYAFRVNGEEVRTVRQELHGREFASPAEMREFMDRLKHGQPPAPPKRAAAASGTAEQRLLLEHRAALEKLHADTKDEYAPPGMAPMKIT